ncbi:ABC-F family ATP-binding cassette domain-containing protein [Rhizobium sp. KVB221]|uniref:ABC-F family ATP-binding cassette domain-containing protein n=1 Tax=Rhizobium setariae TaxID=2801340 RepID=A0A936YJD2_9HYPH|nr:ABC-F family ATP-binding cassette domain-containing protein [Rhizobium setariae]MBL0371248.1 ABC-F family ATP-binding cassette domain-containing protein [Rhizobium setariae]
MIKITELSARIAGRLLIDHATIALPSGTKAGLVGRNGAGKSTLFRILTGDLAAETGSFSMPKNARIGQVAQEAPGTDETLVEIVLAADKERTALLAEAETATDPHRIAEIQIRLADIDAYSAEARAASILAGLGFDEEAQQRPVKSFSGGWRMRVALASVLFAEPDLLLLDEPTNYLDLEGTLWLEEYIKRYPHTVIIISHDRDLLNSAVNSIIHLHQQKLTFYRGTYDSFERQKAEADELQTKAKVKNEAARKHLQSFIDRFKAKATKAKQAQSRVKALERMGTVAAVVHDHVQGFKFPDPKREAASPIIAIENGSVGYTPGKPILKNLNLRIDTDDRIALLGSNGNGKSTFAKLISGRLKSETGSLTVAPNLKIGFFAQHQLDDLIPDQSAVEHVRKRMVGEPEAKVRARTAQMGLPTVKMDTPAKDLSGGEKARLLMGLAAFDAPNLLILDEPTNHLDMDSRRALIEALNDYTGAVILIAHDRHLIEATVDRLWVVNNGSVNVFEGDMDEYRDLVVGSSKKGKKARQAEAAALAATAAAAAAAAEAAKPVEARPRTNPAVLKKKVEDLQGLIAKIERLIQGIDTELGDTTIYSKNPTRAAELTKARANAAQKLADTEEEWLMLSGELEEAAS